MKASDYPYESFNARALSPRQVASGFVPPDSFRKLCKRRHSVIAGPRGSGKTTLLKMLQVTALRNWTHPEAAQFRRQIDFTGIFVPTDRTWGEQLCAVGGGVLNEHQRNLLGVAAFTTQILRATISALIERITTDDETADHTFRKVELSSKQEVALSGQLSEIWRCGGNVLTLLGLRVALTHRLVKIHEVASRCALLPEDERSSFLAETNFLHLNFLSGVPAFLDAFEEVTKRIDERWALLFDELELAPNAIRQSLSHALRSVDQRLIFKLSIAPFSKELEESVKAASDKNDFDLIRLWYPSKEDGYPFSRSLVTQMLRRKGMQGDVEGIFGSTFTDDDTVTSLSHAEYKRAPIFRRLAAKDPTFRAYLTSSGVDSEHITLPTEDQQAATLRKTVSIVAVREAYLRPSTDKYVAGTANAQRSRKSMHLYCGIPAMLAVCEGNPRWLIGLIDALLDSVDKNGRVPTHIQSAHISGLLSRFSAFLKTIPNQPDVPKGARTNVYSLVDAIGKAFTREVLERPFNPDPIGTFLVDSHAPEEQIFALEQAIYAGAIVFVPESDSEIAAGSLRGKRFRLTYLLAPKYKLPLILLRPKSLTSLLVDSNKQQEALFS